MRTHNHLIEKGRIVYGNGFPSVNKNTNGWKIQTIHNRTTTWLVLMQNYSSLSSSSSSPPSRFPPCCSRRAYTSHSKHTHSFIHISNCDFEFGVFEQGFKWESWMKEGGFYNSLHNSIDDLSNSGITHVWLPPPSQSVSPEGPSIPFLDFHHHQIFLSDKP